MKKRVFLIIGLIATFALSIWATAFITINIVNKINRDKVDQARRIAFETHYADRLVLFEEQNKHAQDIDVVFLGDSLTEGYDVESYYPQYKVLNRGIGGDTTTGVLKRLKGSVYDANPKVTAMLIGANNMNVMLNDYEDILIDFKTKAPNMKVVLLSLTSMAKQWGRKNNLAKENNVEIQKYATQYGFSYVDLFNPLLDKEKGECKAEYTIDGGHLTPEGYAVVTSAITPVLEQLLA